MAERSVYDRCSYSLTIKTVHLQAGGMEIAYPTRSAHTFFHDVLVCWPSEPVTVLGTGDRKRRRGQGRLQRGGCDEDSRAAGP